MYTLLDRSAEQSQGVAGDPPSPWGNSAPLILHMCENRSHLPQEARLAFTAIFMMFMAMAIARGLQGHWQVPVYAILTMAGLTYALDRHSKSKPASETLELGKGSIRYCDVHGQWVEYRAATTRLSAEAGGLDELRLFLRGRDGTIEFGRCLNLDERRAVAPIVAAALVQARGG